MRAEVLKYGLKHVVSTLTQYVNHTLIVID